MHASKLDKLLLAVHVGALLPLILNAWACWQGWLGVNWIQAITLRTGKTALVLLVLSLACTPANTLFGFKQALRLRRPLGLYAFLYAALHVLAFAGLDYGFDLELLRDVVLEKRYILAGLAAFLILLPMAITSTRGWMKRLGKRWKRLHRLVYPAALIVIVHYAWQVKSDIREPLLYGGAVVLLLVLRIPFVRNFISSVRSRFRPSASRAR